MDFKYYAHALFHLVVYNLYEFIEMHNTMIIVLNEQKIVQV